MKIKKRITIGELREAMKQQGCREELDEVCRMAISKMMVTTEWLHREPTDEELKNAVRAYWKEQGAGYYEFVSIVAKTPTPDPSP